ncbi:MAG: Verru_Chthon cassette protein A [Verrucomicrobiaceae bacterium]|nr:Verru_Chthon cassette protein A [Verrucomicrobiaceae bacterium]
MKARLSDRERGLAIVVTLLMLALLAVAAIGVLSVSSTHRRSTSAYADSVRTRQLGDFAVNLAVSQIRQGASQEEKDGTPKPWTSQPGAIRTYTAAGELDKLFKLYTAANMVTGKEEKTANDLPTDWHVRLAEFVDLNQPSFRDDDLVYPIADPRSDAEGFAITESNLTSSGSNLLPMPVRWLYTLTDGTLGHLDETNTFIPATDGAKATPENPIVGRFAFWVDDETSKINVNTGSEGVFWDTPRVDTKEERALASFQPARGEFQRFPGHPAMVSLSSVLLPQHRFHATHSQSRLTSMTLEDAEQLWDLAPITNANSPLSSAGGTKVPKGMTSHHAYDRPLVEDPYYTRLRSPHELYWDRRSREPHAFFQRHPEAARRLQRSQFLLTDRNAAPETTLFGTPRISIWPIHSSLDPATGKITSQANKVSLYDNKAALASYIGDQKYYITRSQAWDGEADFRFYRAGSFENEQIFRYLQRLTDRPVPGFAQGGTFAGKYGGGPNDDRDNILLSMMDYARLTNLNDGSLDEASQFCVVCAGNEHVGFGQVTPLIEAKPGKDQDLKAPKGIGRVLTASEVGFLFVCRAEVDSGGVIRGTPSAKNRKHLIEPGDRELEVGLILEGFVPSHGWGEYRPYASVAVGHVPTGKMADTESNELPYISVCDVPLELDRRSRTAKTGLDLPHNWKAWGGGLGARAFSEQLIQFEPIVVSGIQEHLTFSGTEADGKTLSLSFYDTPESADSNRASGDLVQTVVIKAPPISDNVLRLPRMPEASIPATLKKRWLGALQGEQWLAAGDVLQSVVPNHGDHRLIAGKRFVHDSAFVAHPDWGRKALAHQLTEPNGNPVIGSSHGRQSYIPSLEIPAGQTAPDFAFSSGFAQDRLDGGDRGPSRPHLTGDFDNGVGPAPDGPYINRPDDGESRGYQLGDPYFDVPNPNGKALPKVNPLNFAPQRMLPSPVMFGSLPTGVQANVPWQTLLFRPQQEHYGASGLHDHLLLDFFWMPTVEPFPVSRPFETEGKVNMNHVLEPFHHIQRTTALHALFKAEKLMAIPDKAQRESVGHRHYLDADETLRLWDEEVFAKGRTFLSASQICEIPLVPEGETGSRASMEAFWDRHRLTGDNTKERPYAHLHPRLTTRSNSFRIHFMAQSIKKARTTPPNRFISGKDQVLGETTGNRRVERVIDHTHPNLPNYLQDSDAPSLSRFVRYQLSN